MTNLTIAVISFLLETNWLATHTITPKEGFSDSTVYFVQTARVERIEYRIDMVRGKEMKREVDREFVLDLTTNIPPRLWPTNAPPSALGLQLPHRLFQHRQDMPPIPIPPLPPGVR